MPGTSQKCKQWSSYYVLHHDKLAWTAIWHFVIWRRLVKDTAQDKIWSTDQGLWRPTVTHTCLLNISWSFLAFFSLRVHWLCKLEAHLFLLTICWACSLFKPTHLVSYCNQPACGLSAPSSVTALYGRLKSKQRKRVSTAAGRSICQSINAMSSKKMETTARKCFLCGVLIWSVFYHYRPVFLQCLIDWQLLPNGLGIAQSKSYLWNKIKWNLALVFIIADMPMVLAQLT